MGIGADDPEVNPFLRADIPALTSLCGGSVPVLGEDGGLEGAGSPAEAVSRGWTSEPGRALPLDARLDVPGTPQSGTGQAALLTGESTAELYGRHFGPWTPVRLRPLVEERSVLRRALDAGRTVAFANAYPRGWPGPRGGRRIAGPPLAARGAGLLDRHEEALGSGTAVSSEIVNEGWRRHLGHDWLPEVTPSEAGANLAAIAADHDLTLFAHYTTDTVGHRGGMAEAVTALERVDDFLAGILGGIRTDTLLVLASDHGNIEDVRTGHTLHPALGIVSRLTPGRPGQAVARPAAPSPVFLPPHPPSPAAAPPGVVLPSDLRHVAGFVLASLGVETSEGD